MATFWWKPDVSIVHKLDLSKPSSRSISGRWSNQKANGRRMLVMSSSKVRRVSSMKAKKCWSCEHTLTEIPCIDLWVEVSRPQPLWFVRRAGSCAVEMMQALCVPSVGWLVRPRECWADSCQHAWSQVSGPTSSGDSASCDLVIASASVPVCCGPSLVYSPALLALTAVLDGLLAWWEGLSAALSGARVGPASVPGWSRGSCGLSSRASFHPQSTQ